MMARNATSPAPPSVDLETLEVDATSTDPTPSDLSLFESRATPSQGVVTETWYQQRDIEQRVFLLYLRATRAVPRGVSGACRPALLRAAHVRYLRAGLRAVGRGYAGLHASQPWLLYWIVHALDVLGAGVGGAQAGEVAEEVVRHLARCRDHAAGGFGGGPGQEAHLACTYAAVAALVCVGTDEALQAIDREGLRRLLREMKCADGGFRIGPRGEKDVRAVYSAVAAGRLAGVLDERLVANVGSYVRSLVSFDGGMGGEPGTEAHGGNTFCGVAALDIVGQMDAVDAGAVRDWAAMRQCRVEGGFCGRTNKLVDSCYSFWVGALFPLLGACAEFNAEALEQYILTCCQDESGGLADKPGVAKDYHHTCYALSGLSVAQHYGSNSRYSGCEEDASDQRVRRINVALNVCEDRVEYARLFFASMDSEELSLQAYKSVDATSSA